MNIRIVTWTLASDVQETEELIHQVSWFLYQNEQKSVQSGMRADTC